MSAIAQSWTDASRGHFAARASTSVTDEASHNQFVKAGSLSALSSPEEQLLNADIERVRSSTEWTRPAAATAATLMAKRWIESLQIEAEFSGFAWKAPLVTASDCDELTFEWWHRDRKISLYFSEASVEYVKVWGAHVFDQMESGEVRSSKVFRGLWFWLHAE